ncbi:MAG: hypothetical protein QJR08_00245 [Bacillota bacterium]|nr:hypothetical protein [Bacillota bacterium]
MSEERIGSDELARLARIAWGLAAAAQEGEREWLACDLLRVVLADIYGIREPRASDLASRAVRIQAAVTA